MAEDGKPAALMSGADLARVTLRITAWKSCGRAELHRRSRQRFLEKSLVEIRLRQVDHHARPSWACRQTANRFSIRFH